MPANDNGGCCCVHWREKQMMNSTLASFDSFLACIRRGCSRHGRVRKILVDRRPAPTPAADRALPGECTRLTTASAKRFPIAHGAQLAGGGRLRLLRGTRPVNGGGFRRTALLVVPVVLILYLGSVGQVGKFLAF